MSIGRRLIDLARAELNSLLDRAAQSPSDDEQEEERERPKNWTRGESGGMSDAELEAELARRRRARQEAEEAASGRSRPTTAGRAHVPPRTAAGDDAIRKAYSALEVPPGSDFETVRKSYRRMMRKYHPDLHGGSVEKHKAATELTQRLTGHYKTLEKHLRR
jgi:DnaJ-domain-containing protein 1